VRADEWDLPALGLAGNSHMIMMDTNSDDVADRVQVWLTQQGLCAGQAAHGQPRGLVP
jgi:hypothetical protein